MNNTIEQAKSAVTDLEQLDKALAAAEIVPLLMSLVQLGGSTRCLAEAAPFIKGGWSFQTTLPENLQKKIRNELRETLLAVADGRLTPTPPGDEKLTEMMNTSVGVVVPQEYHALFQEETLLDGKNHKETPWRKPVRKEVVAQHQVLIIGAGFSGIGMAIRLAEAGIPYTIVEKNLDVGGTWYENNYPGVAVDTPNHFYSYSFAPNPDWSRYFAKGSEIQNYILDCVKRYGIREKVSFGEEVVSALYDEGNAVWNVTTKNRSGETRALTVNSIVSAVGALNRPATPKIPGLESFDGPVVHTARWKSDLELKGKRVAMIGTGASGMQLGPSIAPEVGKLTIFQRSGHWVIHHPLYFTEVDQNIRWAMRHVPYYMNWLRFQLFWAAADGFHPTLKVDPNWPTPKLSLNAENHKMREDLIKYATSKVGHRPDLLAKVIPDYPPFGKRMLRDANWFDTLLRRNVELVTDKIDHIEPHAVVTANGDRHEVDVLLMATGFEASKMLAPMHIVGRDGIVLREIWGDEDPRAHLGITVPGFPNFFLIYGPNTNLAHGGSAIFHSECQVRYISQALREVIERGAASIEVREEPFEEYNARVDEAHRGMVWNHGGVSNWYKNKKGRVVMNSPWRLIDYRNMTAEIDTSDFVFENKPA